MFYKSFGILLQLYFVLCHEFKSTWGAMPTRTVVTKQGPVRGLKIDLRQAHVALGVVDAFLGIPYAGPPIGPLRFMPPTSPQPWTYLREVTDFAPVCPQILPDLNDTQKALEYMTVGRLNYLKNLLRYLHRQSEDCLYLNIYTPSPRTDKNDDRMVALPVIVFVHGESYEWNSGNPYDGSVLSAYGKVVVITLNYRLGILGFLRPGLNEDTVTNFGLLDQIAALHWLQENVAFFGGDPNQITMVGHGTGASLVSLLMTSPVAQAKKGLFRRAILMSGSSLSPMSICKDPASITLQTATKLNCPLRPDYELARCLQQRPLEEIHKVLFTLEVPKYSTPFGPIVDRLIVPNDPAVLMSDSNPSNSFAKYDVMVGLTEIEAFHLFPASTATYGVSSKEQKKIVREFVKHTFKANVDQVQTAILNEYIDYRYTEDNYMVNRNTLLSILSDARVAAPLLQTAKFHSEITPSSIKTYFYVFKHVTKYGHYPEVYGSIHGEELAYMLGMPLTGGSYHLKLNYTRTEQTLSEFMMQYWISFAKTGNASGSPIRPDLLFSDYDERFEDVTPRWPAYEMDSQKYLSVGTNVEVKEFYRPHKIALWNYLIPSIVKAAVNKEPEKPDPPRFGLPESPEFAASPPHLDTYPEDHVEPTRPPNAPRNPPKKNPSYGLEVEAGVPIVVVIIIGLILLLLNLCACIGVVYQKHRVRQRELNLRMRIKRLSDVGMISGSLQDPLPGHPDDEVQVDGYCAGGGRSGDHCGEKQIRRDKIYRDSSEEEDEIDVVMPQHYAMDADGIYPITHMGSLKSSLKRNTNPPSHPHHHYPPMNNRSYEALYLTPHDRSDLHNHSKSIANFPIYESRGFQSQSPGDAYPMPHGDKGSLRSKSSVTINTIQRHPGESDKDQVNPRRLGLPKVLPDLPSLGQFLSRKRGNNSSPPSPIIEVVPVSQYEAMFPNRSDPKQNYAGVVFPNYNHSHNHNHSNYHTVRPSDCDHQSQQQQPQFMNCHDTYEIRNNYPHYTSTTLTPQGSHSNYVHFQPAGKQQFLTSQRDFPNEELNTRQNPEGSSNAHKVAFTLPPQQATPMRLPLSTLTNEKKNKDNSDANPNSSKSHLGNTKHSNEISGKHHAEPKSGPHPTKNVQGQGSKTSEGSGGFATIQKQPRGKGDKSVSNPETNSPVKPPIADKPVLKKQESVKDAPKVESKQVNEKQGTKDHDDIANEPSKSRWLALNRQPSKSDIKAEDEVHCGTPKPDPAPLAREETLDDHQPKADSSKAVVIKKVGEKTPPGTLKKERIKSSCQSWYSQYSQSFLAKTIDTPLPEVHPMEDENEKVSVL